MTEAVWSALEQLVCGEYVKQQIICHETGPIVVSGRNISGKSRIEERFANSEVMLQIHSRVLKLSIIKNKKK